MTRLRQGIALGAPFAALPQLHFSPHHRGRSSVVELLFPMLHVVGSIPIARPWTALDPYI